MDWDGPMTTLMASVHGDGKMVWDCLNDLHDNTTHIFTAHVTFAAMVRIRVLEQRIEELKAECARLEAVARVGY
jgi:hypothetical protein